MRRIIGTALLVLACGDASPSAKTPPTPPPKAQTVEAQPLTVWFAGCREVRAGPVCAVEPGTTSLRLWAEVDPGFSTTVSIDGSPVDVDPAAVEGGLRWEVKPPAEAHRLEVRAELDGVARTFELRLDATPEQGLAALEPIRTQPDFELARTQLAALLPSLRGGDRGRALALDGDLAFNLGDLDAVQQRYDEAFALVRDAGRLRQASTLAQRLVFVCLALRHDEGCAQRWLEHDEPLAADDPEQALFHAYYEGLLAEHRGDLRAAGVAHRRGARMARALGLESAEAAALVEQMVLVGRLGAWTQARTLQARALELAPRLETSIRSQLLNAIAWMLLEAQGRGVQIEQQPEPLLRRALEGLDADNSLVADMRNTVMLNLAYAAVLGGHAPSAREWLERVDPQDLQHLPEDRLWRQLLLARVALLDGAMPLARRRFAELLAEAQRLYEPELRWQALLGQAEVEEALGHTEAALVSYERAETQLEAQLPRIAMGDGRGRFMAERERGVRRQVELLLALGRPEQALCVARLARTRSLRTVARQVRRLGRATPQQQDALRRHRQTRARLEADYDQSWSLPAAASRQRQRQLETERRENQEALDRLLGELDPGVEASAGCTDLAHPGPDALDLHFVQLDDGWVVFAQHGDRLGVHRLGPLELPRTLSVEVLARWSVALVEPLAEELSGVAQIRVMPSGALGRVPFHALPMPGAPQRVLLDVAPVRYGLDLPHAESPAPAGRNAVVVAPPSNLRHAIAESEAVGSMLVGAGWTVARIEGDEARGDVVRPALPTADLLHYVGHARSDGLEGWSSTLALARDSSIDVGDVLALPRAPRTVVLNGCETGRLDTQSLAGGMSLAHAFVLAGAQMVVATDRQVDDAAAAALIRAFYGALGEGEPSPRALRAALTERRAHDDGWLYTRAWVP